MSTRMQTVYNELRHHMPLTLVSSLLAGILIGGLYLSGYIGSGFMEKFFDIAHPFHVLVSAAATASIYYKYKKSFVKSIIIGILGAIIVGTFSDVLLPWIAGGIFNLDTVLHLPFLEEPLIIFGAAIVGSLFAKNKNVFTLTHNSHVFLSVFASLAYLLAFSMALNFWAVLLVSVIVFAVVYIPCCISDIAFPIFFIKNPCKDCGHWHDEHKKK